MLVRCPKCETGFNLPVEKIPAKGAKLRCSACTHGFRVRVDDDGELLVGDRAEWAAAGKPAGPVEPVDGDRTQIGGLFRSDTGGGEARGKDDITPVGVVKRSRSAVAGYNPFPLARNVGPARGNETQVFGSSPSEAEEDDGRDDSLDSIELHDADLDESSESTQLGKHAFANERDNNSTMLSPLGRTSTVGGDVTPPVAAFDDEAMDLFSDLELPDAKPPADLSDDFDPFGDAFSDVGNEDVGLLRPSTPSLEESSGQRQSFAEMREDEADLPGMSEEAFFSGGHRSDYGAAENMVDPAFGDDVATFDPGRGVVRNGTAASAPKAAASAPKAAAAAPEIEIGLDLETARPAAKASPAKRSAARSSNHDLELDRVEESPRRSSSGPRPVVRSAPAIAPHQIGATSAVRRFFDIVFITLVVVVGFVSVVAVMAGGFLDFSRFGHMLEVAFGGEEFQPRPEWAVVVTPEPVEPPPDNPLRLENVRSSEIDLGKDRVLIISGILRNYSNAQFKAVEIRAEVVDRDGKVVSSQTVPAGRALDREKVVKATTLAGVEALVEEKVSDIGADGTLPFTVVFTDVPRAALEAGKLDYRVAIVE